GYLDNGQFVLLPSLPGGVTRAIVEDGRRTLWIVKSDSVFHLAPGTPDKVERIPRSTLAHDDPISAAAAHPSGDGLWLGFFRGGVSFVAGGQVRASYTAADGLARGRISSLYTDSAGTLW